MQSVLRKHTCEKMRPTNRQQENLNSSDVASEVSPTESPGAGTDLQSCHRLRQGCGSGVFMSASRRWPWATSWEEE